MKFSLFFLFLFFCVEVNAGTPLIPYRKGDKWGYANATGAVVVKPVYTSVSHYGNVCHIVELNGKYGLLNSEGKKIVDLLYDNITFMQSDLGLILTKKGKQGAMDNDGKILLPCIYDEIDYYPDRREVSFRTGNKRGIYSLTTRKILSVPEADNSIVMEEVMAEDGKLATRDDLRYFVIAAGSKKKIGKETKTITFRNGAPIRTRVVMDTLAFAYDRVVPLNYYKLPAVLFQENKKWGVVLHDVIAAPPTYDSISTTVINHACEAFYFEVMNKGKWGIMDARGQEKVPLLYDKIVHESSMSESGMSCFDTTHGIMVRNANKSGIISLTGETVVPVEQDSIVFDNRKSYHIYFQGNHKGVYGARFKSGLVFSTHDELSDLVDFDGVVVLKVVDSNRKVTNKWNEQEPYLKGYISSSGIRFYEE